MNKIVLPPLPEPDIVVDNAGRAWSASMNREVDGIRYYAASHLHAYTAAVSAAKDKEIERLRAECAQLRADAIDRQNNVVVSLRKRVMTLEIELGEYANPLNWEEDEQGVRRMWREPWTRTPTAYDGFESARKALES